MEALAIDWSSTPTTITRRVTHGHEHWRTRGAIRIMFDPSGVIAEFERRGFACEVNESMQRDIRWVSVVGRKDTETLALLLKDTVPPEAHVSWVRDLRPTIEASSYAWCDRRWPLFMEHSKVDSEGDHVLIIEGEAQWDECLARYRTWALQHGFTVGACVPEPDLLGDLDFYDEQFHVTIRRGPRGSLYLGISRRD